MAVENISKMLEDYPWILNPKTKQQRDQASNIRAAYKVTQKDMFEYKKQQEKESLPTRRQPGPRGGQGTRPDQYVPPIAGGGFSSLADEFAGNQQFNPREYAMSSSEYPDYLKDLQYANELREAAGLEPLPVQSLEELNRGLYTANLVGPQGMSRILPTPTEQDGMGYFGDRFAGPTQEPTRAQPSRGAIQRTPTIPAGVVTPTPTQQVGQAATQQPSYQATVQQMMGQAPQPATVNAPPMQVTSPMSGVGATTERAAGQQGTGVGSPTGIASGVQGGAGARVGAATGTPSADGPQNIFALRSVDPEAYARETDARNAAITRAMRSGEKVLMTDKNLFIGEEAYKAAPGTPSPQITGPFNPQTSAQAREYNQRVNAAVAAGQPASSVQGFTPRPDGQQSYGGLTGEDLIFAAQQRAFGGQSGIAAGAGDPEANRARYEQNLADMARLSEFSDRNSMSGRARARQTEREQARLERIAARKGTLTPQQQIEEGRLERESRERIAGVEAGVRASGAQDKAQTDMDNAAIGRATTINRSFVQRGISSAVSRINSMAGTSGLNENQKSMLKEFEGLQKEDAWKTFIEEMTKAQHFRSASPELEQWASRFDTALSIEDPEFFLNNMKTLYDAWSKT